MDDLIDYQNVFGEIQKNAVEILQSDEWFATRGLTILPENILDIDYQIKNALGKQGCVIVVTTMQATYAGHDGMVEDWTIDNLEIDVVENPSIHRPRLKKLGLEDGTTSDILYRIAERLGGPQGGHFGKFCPKSCEVGEDSSLVVGKAKFSCAFRHMVTGIIDPETKVEIPFVTRVDIQDLLDEVDYLKNLIVGFDTEQIKTDVNNLKDENGRIIGRIDDIEEGYQKKGDYATKDEIPTKTSQLRNDSGYMTYVEWSEVRNKPAVALKSDLPTKVSQLDNDENYLKSVTWDDVKSKPDVALKTDLPTKTSQLENDSGFISNVYWDDISDKPEVALKSDLPTKVSQLENDSEFATKSRVYELETFVRSVDAIASEAKTESGKNTDKINELETAIEDVDGRIPTKTSQLENDSGFLTEHQPLADYATKSELTETETKLDESIHILSDNIWSALDEKADVVDIPTKTSQLENDSEFSKVVESPDYPGYAENARESMFANQSVYAEIATNVTNVEWDQIKNKPDLVDQSEFDSTTTILQVQIDKNKDDIANLAVDKLYGQYKSRYIDGDRGVWEKQTDGTYLKVGQLMLTSEKPTKTSQLENDSGFLTDVEWSDVEGKPTIPTKTSELINDENFLKTVTWQQIQQKPTIPTKTSELINDENFLKTVNWQQIQDKPTIPTKTSQLQNDAGFLTGVDWSAVTGKPDLATQQELDSEVGRLNVKIDQKLSIQDYDNTKIYNQSRNKYIDGDLDVKVEVDGGYSPWTFDNGYVMQDNPAVFNVESGYRIGIDQDTYHSTQLWTDENDAISYLETATDIEITDGNTTTYMRREHLQSWETVDRLATMSDIPTSSGITEERARQIVEGYGYQNASQVDSIVTSKGYQTESQVESRITSKGYRTESQVESQITSKGYQTESQVLAIASSTLPTGYAETQMVGTLEDGTEITFTMLIKGLTV